MPILAEKNTLRRSFLPSQTASFHLSTEKVRVRSVGIGHQSGYSHADTKNNNTNKRSKKFSIRRNYYNALEK